MVPPNPFSREAFLASSNSNAPHKPPRRRGRKWLFSGIFCVVLGVALGGFLIAKPFPNERSRSPYPDQQNGFTLLAIHASDYKPFQQTSPTTYIRGYPSIEVALPRGTLSVRAEARAPTGERFPLEKGIIRTLPVAPLDLILNKRQSVQVNLPQFGIPAIFQYLDVTVEDDRNHRGTWRVFDLPHLKHGVLSTTPLHEKESLRGISLDARAWRENAPSPGNLVSPLIPIRCEVKAIVPSSALSTPKQSWSLQIQSCHLEWEPSVPSSPFSTDTNNYTGETQGPLIGPGISYARVDQVADFVSLQHVALIKARLVRYTSTVETVTFRDLPLFAIGKVRQVNASLPSSLRTTPSGIRVQFYSPDASYSAGPGYGPDDVAFRYGLSLAPNFSLPYSLKEEQNRRTPSRIMSNVYLDKKAFAEVKHKFLLSRYGDSQETSIGTNTVHLYRVSQASRKILPILTINVVHQAEQEIIPIVFTVPIQTSKPTGGGANRNSGGGGLQDHAMTAVANALTKPEKSTKTPHRLSTRSTLSTPASVRPTYPATHRKFCRRAFAPPTRGKRKH